MVRKLRDASMTDLRLRLDAMEPSDIQRSTPSPAPRRKTKKTRKFSLQRTGYALLIGISVLAAIGVPMNALFFQDVRHPAPMFLTAAITPTSPTPVVTKSTPLHPVETAVAPIETTRPKAGTSHQASKYETVRKDILPTAKIPARTTLKPAEAAKHDPIADLLNGAPHPKELAQNDVLIAQQALLKLGYVVRADGKFNRVTKQAIEKFEHDNGLMVKGALTSQIAALLASRAGIESE
jgi:hypothetical protein